MNNKLIPIVLTLVVGIILAGSVLVPVLNDATRTEQTFTNEGVYYMTEIDAETIVYTFDGTKWTIDGEDMSIAPNSSTTLIAGDGFIIRSDGQLRGSTSANPVSIQTLTVTASGISMAYTKADTTTSTASVSGTVYYYAVNDKTSHILSGYTTPVYLNGDSEVFGDGLSNVASATPSVFKVEGTIDDGFTVTPQRDGVTVSEVVCNYEAVAGYKDLYKVTSITFNTTYNDEVRAQSYSSYIVPTEVTSELSEHLTPGQIALMGTIPVLVIVALLVVAVGVVARRND